MSFPGEEQSNRNRPNHRPKIDDSLDELDGPKFYVLEKVNENPLIDRRGFIAVSVFCMGAFLAGCNKTPTAPLPPPDDPVWHELPYKIDAHYKVLNSNINPDGRSISSFGAESLGEVTIKKWGIPSGKLLDKRTYAVGYLWGPRLSSFNSSGELFFASIPLEGWNDDGTRIVIYDWASLQQTMEVVMPGEVLEVNRAMYAAVENSTDGNLEIRDIATNTVLRSVSMPATGGIGLSPDGHWAFLRRETGDFELLSILQPEEDRILTHSNNKKMISAIFSPDNRYIAALVDTNDYNDNELIIWDLESTGSSPMAIHWKRKHFFRDCTFSHDGQQIVAVWSTYSPDEIGIDIISAPTGNITRAKTFPSSMPYQRAKLSVDNCVLVLLKYYGNGIDVNEHGIIDYFDLEKMELITNLFDADDTWKEDRGGAEAIIRYYSLQNNDGVEVMYTTSHRNKLPSGSICSCDHVQGERIAPPACGAHCLQHCPHGGCVPVQVCPTDYL